MDDWTYCVTLPKVSRTFALNISVLRGTLHRNILATPKTPIKISRGTVRRAVLGTPFIVWLNCLLKISFNNIINDKVFKNLLTFDLEELMTRLKKIPLDAIINSNT